MINEKIEEAVEEALTLTHECGYALGQGYRPDEDCVVCKNGWWNRFPRLHSDLGTTPATQLPDIKEPPQSPTRPPDVAQGSRGGGGHSNASLPPCSPGDGHPDGGRYEASGEVTNTEELIAELLDEVARLTGERDRALEDAKRYHDALGVAFHSVRDLMFERLHS